MPFFPKALVLDNLNEFELLSIKKKEFEGGKIDCLQLSSRKGCLLPYQPSTYRLPGASHIHHASIGVTRFSRLERYLMFFSIDHSV